MLPTGFGRLFACLMSDVEGTRPDEAACLVPHAPQVIGHPASRESLRLPIFLTVVVRESGMRYLADHAAGSEGFHSWHGLGRRFCTLLREDQLNALIMGLGPAQGSWFRRSLMLR